MLLSVTIFPTYCTVNVDFDFISFFFFSLGLSRSKVRRVTCKCDSEFLSVPPVTGRDEGELSLRGENNRYCLVLGFSLVPVLFTTLVVVFWCLGSL